MDEQNSTPSNKNILNTLKTPKFFALFMGFVIFLIISIFLIYFDVNVVSWGKTMSSHEELIGNIFIIIFFSILIIGICILLLPNAKELKELFGQIGNVTAVIIYTIFIILFYTMMSKNTLDNYSYIINPLVLLLGIFAFYKGASTNFIENYNVNYERIKMMILLFCLITIIITIYNINPGGAAEKYFGYSLLITIIITVFAFLYMIVLLTLPDDEGKKSPSILTNFSSLGGYGTIFFFLFLAMITLMISINREKFFENQAKASGVIILTLIISILWAVLLGANLFSDVAEHSNNLNKVGLFKKGLLTLFGIVISALLIFWITYNIENVLGNSNTTSFILNLILVGLILSFIYRTMNVKMPVGNSKKNAFFELIKSVLFYIPCFISGIFDQIGAIATGKDPQTASQIGSIIMILVMIGLVVLHFTMPSIFGLISKQGGKQLVNWPVYTDTQYDLGGYQDLNESEEFDYQYGISCWIFIDSAGPNTNPNYNKYTSLLNFGEKPNILYNGSKRRLMITMQQKDLQKVTQNDLLDFDDNGNRIIYINDNILLQKWNNIIINYNGGTLDIFLNGELVKSSPQVVPYYTFDKLTIGQENGIKGGMCNVNYFRKPLNTRNVFFLYNTLKDKTPPILNDSTETILV